jgi:zinc protease
MCVILHRMNIRSLAATLFLLLAAAQLGAALPSPVQNIEGITEYRLENGLQVLLFPDPGKATATVNITYKVGSRNENYGETGMAHLLEHLIFKGTPKHPNIPQELTEHGTRPNGSTWYDRTNYFESFQASDENLRWALELEADRMVNSYISGKDLWNPETKTGEMTVVRNEMESGENEPSRVLMQRVLACAFEWHNYGKETIGARSDVENVDIPRLQAFYHTWYQPDNAVLLVAGRFDPEKTLGWIVETFGALPRPTRTLQKTYTLDPVQDGEREVTVRRVGEVNWLMAGYKIPAGSDPDSSAINLVSQILGDTPNGRLHAALVKSGLATEVFAFPFQLREPGLLLLGLMSSKDARLEEVRTRFLDTIEKTADTPFTEEELARAKMQLAKQVELTLNDTERVGLAMSESIAAGDWRLFFLDRDRAEGVTLAQLNEAARHYLKRDNRTLGVFIPTEKPDRSEIPAMKDVAEMLKDYKGREAIAQGEAFDTDPMAIEAHIQHPVSAVGLDTSIVAKKTRGNKVNVNLTLHFADEKALLALPNQEIGDFAGGMLMRGTTKHSRKEIADLLDSMKTQLHVVGGSSAIIVRFETTRAQLPKLIPLIGEILREPSYPADEIEEYRREQLDSLEQERSEPQAIAYREFQIATESYPVGHPFRIPSLDEAIARIKGVNREALVDFHARFHGVAKGELAVVGDCDANEVVKAFDQALAGWRSAAPYSRIVSPEPSLAVVRRDFETPDKQNSMVIAGQRLRMRQDDADYAGLTLADFMLGGGFLNSRLATRIRQKEGLSYGVGCGLYVSPLDKVGLWEFYAICAPQNADKVVKALDEELTLALKDGFREDEIKAAKAGWLQSRQVSRGQEGELAGTLSNNAYLGRTMAFQADLEKRVMALSAAEIVAALRARIDPARNSVIRAGDFKAAAGQK